MTKVNTILNEVSKVIKTYDSVEAMTNGTFYLDFPDIDDTYITIHTYHRDRSKEYSKFNI